MTNKAYLFETQKLRYNNHTHKSVYISPRCIMYNMLDIDIK